MFIEQPATNRSVAFRKPVIGLGINDAPYKTQPKVDGKNIMCPFFSVWRSMLIRCYSGTYHKRQPTYKDCTVSDDWLSFMSFRSWMEKQDWVKKHLDKDILVSGNKIYSKETCIFVPREVNNLLNDHRAGRGKFPIGVCKSGNKYMAQCSGRENRYIGLYNTPHEAHTAWATEKAKVIREVADKQHPKLKEPLLKFATIIDPIYAC